jgi:Dienelactone hydrolase family
MTAASWQLVEIEDGIDEFNEAHEFYSYPKAGHAFMDSTKESYRPMPTKLHCHAHWNF